MASIRRALSPVPRPGARSNGEAHSVASPLSKSSSSVQSPLHPGDRMSYSSFNTLEYSLYRLNQFVLGLCSSRSSRPLEKSKSKGKSWKRALLHFLMCFLVGVFIGLTPFASTNMPGRLMPEHQRFFFDMNPSTLSAVKEHSTSITSRNDSPIVGTLLKNDASSVERMVIENHTLREQYQGLKDLTNRVSGETLMAKALAENLTLGIQKPLIIVTPTHNRPFQAYYLNRLAQTLRLVPPPFLWIVVDMTSQSAETAEILRKTGVMYRHLVCKKNITDVRDMYVHQRNAALAHIELHRLDGIVYFAEESDVYSVELFTQMRQIRRFGTWRVARLTVTRGAYFQEGPICNGSEVIGWKTNRLNRRFHSDNTGFCFNSTILWDPKRWHRPILEPIRLLDTVRESFKVSTFIEQIVEDESQMEGLLGSCLSIKVWHHALESFSSSYPPHWILSRNMEKQLPVEEIDMR